jgi:predicted metal-dependent hydrolase
MKTVTVADIGEVQIVKHATAKSLRITIRPGGIVRVTIPRWTPYQAGTAFVLSRKEWILQNLQPQSDLKNGMAIGKFHHLYFAASPTNKTISTRQKGSELWVTYPDSFTQQSSAVQEAAVKVAIRALRTQAENLLPNRLRTLADKHGFDYKSVEVRQLKARWGSCNSKQEITLNLFLMQLPWDLIDYVLLHELTHTKALHHGPEFWEIFEAALPGAKKQRKALHSHKPNF